jgi:hypothetical protein
MLFEHRAQEHGGGTPLRCGLAPAPSRHHLRASTGYGSGGGIFGGGLGARLLPHVTCLAECS